MPSLTFTGWHIGMRKRAFTLLLRQKTDLGLKEARATLLRVLDEQPVTPEVKCRLVMQVTVWGIVAVGVGEGLRLTQAQGLRS